MILRNVTQEHLNISEHDDLALRFECSANAESKHYQYGSNYAILAEFQFLLQVTSRIALPFPGLCRSRHRCRLHLTRLWLSTFLRPSISLDELRISHIVHVLLLIYLFSLLSSGIEMSTQEAPGPDVADQHTEKKVSQASGTKLEYPPLEPGSKQIRLLHIEAGISEVAECTLHICDLAKEPHYETISYVWGDPHDRDLVRINGHDVSVPASSARAIRRVRLPEQKSRVIWIDAICIDQSNFGERSQQVAIMGEIYKAGLANMIYLGDENFEAAIGSIRGLRADAYEQDSNFLLMTFRRDPGFVHYEKARSNHIRVQYNHEALAGLYANAWFR